MKLDFRSSVLALTTSALVVVGSAACSAQGMTDTVSSVDPTQTGENSQVDSAQETLAGELEFLAPGEFIIDGQAFYIAEDTRILGGHHVCPAEDGVDETGFGIVECDLETLEAAVQGDTAVFAEVEMNGEGNAESVTEYDNDSHYDSGEPDGSEGAPEEGAEAPEESGGFTGTATGELEYIAPGEYRVDGTAFYVAEDTTIIAGIYACAEGVQDPDTGEVRCDFDEFDATLANGTVILASVEMVDGIAESITEYEA